MRLGRLGRNAKVDLIKRVPLFGECSKADLTLIAAIADEVDLPAGKTLMAEGERGREFFVLVEGRGEVRRKGRKIDTIGPGDFVGEMAIVSQKPRNATVKLTEPSRVLVVTDRAFRSLMRESPTIQLKVLQALADRVPESA